jgi:hypothetical protein
MTPLAGLGAVGVVLGALLGWELASSQDDLPAGSPANPQPVQARAPSTPSLGILTDLTATVLARPLFSPDRRLAPPGPAVAVVETIEEPPRLAAVIVGPSGGLAIFEDASGRPHVAAEGDSLGHFKVGAIAPGQVSLITPEGERVLRPKYASPAGTPVAQNAPPGGSRQ